MNVEINAGHNNWLNQKKLHDALYKIYKSSWLGGEYSVKVPTEKRPNTKVKIDIAFILGDQKIAVEYDGNMHYINTQKCLRDIKKKHALKAAGFKVICFPFYMELDSESFSHFFGKDINGEDVVIINKDPKHLLHGFNETEWMPIDFCPLGLKRFEEEYHCLPESIQTQIAESLCKKAEVLGMENVVPKETLKALGIVFKKNSIEII